MIDHKGITTLDQTIRPAGFVKPRGRLQKGIAIISKKCLGKRWECRF